MQCEEVKRRGKPVHEKGACSVIHMKTVSEKKLGTLLFQRNGSDKHLCF
jgi:hypothetical protein